MANLGSLALGVVIVSAIGGMSYLLRQNKSRQFTEAEFVKSVSQVDFDFAPQFVAFSQDARAAIGLSKSNKLYVGRSIGDEFSIRELQLNKIIHEYGFVKFAFGDFTFPDFTAKFDSATLEAINAKLHSA